MHVADTRIKIPALVRLNYVSFGVASTVDVNKEESASDKEAVRD